LNHPIEMLRFVFHVGKDGTHIATVPWYFKVTKYS